MKTRLAIFVVTLLLLPPLALLLAGQEWESPAPIAGAFWMPALFAFLALLVFALLLDALTFRRTRHSLLRAQRTYLLWSGVTGAVVGLLLAYLNLFAGAWVSPADTAAALLLSALGGCLLLPAVLIARLWLAGLLRLQKRFFALPVLPAEPAAYLLLLAALGGLLCGTVWPNYFGWLLWLSPLLLLLALQILWHESHLFAGLAQGDWSRVLLGAASGIVVGVIVLAVYDASGGALYFSTSSWQLMLYLAAFGLLCLQIGDVVAEHWRGKPRGEVFKKKPFPIPVVTKKDI